MRDNRKVIKQFLCVISVVSMLHIYIRSEGKDDPLMTDGRKGSNAYIFVNGEDYSPHRRGHNVVIVDAKTGKVVLYSAGFFVLLLSRNRKLKNKIHTSNGFNSTNIALKVRSFSKGEGALRKIRYTGRLSPKEVLLYIMFKYSNISVEQDI